METIFVTYKDRELQTTERYLKKNSIDQKRLIHS